MQLTGSISGTNGITISELLEKPNLTLTCPPLQIPLEMQVNFENYQILENNWPVLLPPKLCSENEVITNKLNMCEAFNHCFISSGNMFAVQMLLFTADFPAVGSQP